MKCLETRTTAAGWKRRRYDSGLTTLEIPAEVVDWIGKDKLRAAMERWRFRADVAALPGERAKVVAAKMGVSVHRVYHARRPAGAKG